MSNHVLETKKKNRLLSTLKWLVAVIVISFLAVGAGAASGLAVALVFLALIFFPGKSPEAPRAWKWAPALWVLNFLSAVALIAVRVADVRGLPPQLLEVTPWEMGLNLVANPVFLVLYFRRPEVAGGKALNALLAIGAVYALVSAVWESVNGDRAALQFWLEEGAAGIAESIFLAYLLKFRLKVFQANRLG